MHRGRKTRDLGIIRRGEGLSRRGFRAQQLWLDPTRMRCFFFLPGCHSSCALQSSSVIIPKIYDFFPDFYVVSSLLFRLRWEYSLIVSLIGLLVLVQQNPLSLSILRFNLVGFFKSIEHSFLLLLERIIDFPLPLLWSHVQHFERIR